MLSTAGEAAVIAGTLARIAQRSAQYRVPDLASNPPPSNVPQPASATAAAPSPPSCLNAPQPAPPSAPTANPPPSPPPTARLTMTSFAATPEPPASAHRSSTRAESPVSASRQTPEFEPAPFEAPPQATPLKTARMPSSRFGRLLHYGSLGAGLAWGAVGAAVSGSADQGWMSESNMRRLVDKLSTMRGAALKVGQFLSIQARPDMPGPLEEILARVQASAHAMPEPQLRSVLHRELGPDWRSRFSEFDLQPFAAASIGQVHRAVLSPDATAEQLGLTEPIAAQLRGKAVAVKIQFPGVRKSIDSDLGYLKWVLSASALLPPGLFLESSLKVLSAELADECDYEREARMGEQVRQLVESDPEGAGKVFAVPRVVPGLSTKDVLTAEFMPGKPLARAAAAGSQAGLDQEQRNILAGQIMRLALLELFQWKTMQTDPNYANFLWDAQRRKVALIDFGATREYSQRFIDLWLRLLQSAIRGDRAACAHWSRKIGYLTGKESSVMIDAHVDSMVLLGTPFRTLPGELYDFSGQDITDKVRGNIPLMLRERKTPPPQETYSLNRKLSGAFLLCARLDAQVPCGDIWRQVTEGYKFDPEGIAAVPFSRASAPSTTRSAPAVPASPASVAAGRGLHTMSQVRILHTMPDERVRSRRRLSLSDRWPRLRENKPPASEKDKADKLAVRGYDPTRRSEGKSVWVRNIKLPSPPSPPGPGDCCMSGCSVCVYDLYGDALEEYRELLQLAKIKIAGLRPPVTRAEWSDRLGLFPDDQAEQDAKKRAEEQALSPAEREKQALEEKIDQLYPVDMFMDPTMKAFYDLERNIKHKQAETHPEVVEQELNEMAQQASDEHKAVKSQLAHEEAKVQKQTSSQP